MTGRRTRQTPAANRRPVAARTSGRLCSSCGARHEPPTGRMCDALRSPVQDDLLNTQLDTSGNSVSSNLLQSPILANNVRTSVVPPIQQVSSDERLNMLINTCSDLVTNVAGLQARMEANEAREQDRLNQSWANLSNAAQGKVSAPKGAPSSRGLPQTLPFQQTSSPREPVLPQQTLPTVPELRAMPGLPEQAAAIQAALQRETNCTVLQGKALKSGRDRVGGSDHSRIFVKWPQEACFIGPSRIRVRYDELTQPQWTAGITAIAAEEKDPVIQRNMFTYLASILQDTCDFGFKSCLGAHALILSNIEDQILTWEDLPAIQKVRENFTHRFQASAAPNRTDWSAPQTGFTARSQPSSKRRICARFNSGLCTKDSSHVTNGCTYDHYCSFCSQSGRRYGHSEQNCKRKTGAAGASVNMHSNSTG